MLREPEPSAGLASPSQTRRARSSPRPFWRERRGNVWSLEDCGRHRCFQLVFAEILLCPGEILLWEGSGGFPAEGWCWSLSVAARGCLCVKNCQNGVCVLGVPGTPLGKAGSLGAGAFALRFLPLGPSGVFTLLLFFTFKCLRIELCPCLSIPVISPLSQ